MHQHKTLAQVILILSIVNFVLAAPVVREIHKARDDMIVRVLAEDVGAVAEKRGNVFGTHMIPWEDSDWDSGDEGYGTAEDEPSGHSSTPTEQPPPAPSQKRPKIITPARIKATKIITGVGLLTAAVLGIVDIQISSQNSSAS
jgi:hypothetical protein